MNLKLDFLKDLEGSHELHLALDLIGHETAKFVVPIGKDLLYALYKGVNLELKHLDVSLNEFGKEMQTQALAATAPVPEVTDEPKSKEKIRTTYSALSAPEENPAVSE